MSRRQRLDADMVRRAIVSSRTEAVALIESGRVLVNGAIAIKPSRQVDPADNVLLSGPPSRFVSRGGEKLDGALDSFGIDVTGCRILDAGASTGGFTDCVLQRGAEHVVALDVGHGQLHPKIRGDKRVTVIERFNIREVTPEAVGGLVDMAVADLSFISLTVVVAAIVSVVRPGGALVLLVKPQFESGRREVSKSRGVITDPALHEQACGNVVEACEAVGAEVLGIIDSPLLGGHRNREFLLYARCSAHASERMTT